jgi:predicted dienelactone hydrolase
MPTTNVRRSFLGFLALLSLGLSGLDAQPPRPELRPDAPTYAKHGPYWVGTREFVIKDAVEGIALPATLWYPALNPSGLKAAHTYALDTRQASKTVVGMSASLSGGALGDAAPDPAGRPYPLVVLSPGFERSRLMYTPFLEHLASHGFTVLGVDHVPDVFTRRPKDVMRAIDFAAQLAAPGGAFPGFMDMQQVALVGHSVGAKTVMNAGKVRFSRAAEDPFDPRVKAIVPMAMAETTVFMNTSEAKLPVLFWLGSKDKFRPVADMEEIYQAMPGERKALVVLIGGGHSLSCDPAMATLKPDWSWGTLDLSRAQDLINHITTAFLLDVLKGDKEAHKALLPEAVKFEEIQYTTTWK